MPQFSLPCSVYRGGTSRGLMFHQKDLPADPVARNRIFLAGIDAYNPAQVDGLGGASSSTSKVCVIAPPSRPGVQGDWTFFQVGAGVPVVDDQGTCGNMMAAVGAFMVDEGLVPVAPDATAVDVHVYNTNIAKTLCINVPLVAGKACVTGTHAMPGVVRHGALIQVAIVAPGGETTGRWLPLGPTTEVTTARGRYTVTFADLINPFIFLAGEAFGLAGDEAHAVVASAGEIIEELNLIRDKLAVCAGLASDERDARQRRPGVPKIALLAPAQDYRTTAGEWVRRAEVDILIKAVSMGKLHRTCPASGLYNLAALVPLAGTVAHRIATQVGGEREKTVRIGHPEGVVEVRVVFSADGLAVASVGMERTARRIMRGELFIPVNP